MCIFRTGNAPSMCPFHRGITLSVCTFQREYVYHNTDYFTYLVVFCCFPDWSIVSWRRRRVMRWWESWASSWRTRMLNGMCHSFSLNQMTVIFVILGIICTLLHNIQPDHSYIFKLEAGHLMERITYASRSIIFNMFLHFVTLWPWPLT